MNQHSTHIHRAASRILAQLSTTVACAALLAPAGATASTCFGTTDSGRIEGAVTLPASGRNFSAYSALGVQLGRTYVHTTVRDIVAASYRELEAIQPGMTYVYGETGLRNGGPMPPHRTHATGTSVDFMVPVRASDGSPTTLPASAANRFGYDLEFDSKGVLGNLRIDYAALAAHLDQLNQQARKHNAAIKRVIFDPALARHLFDTPAGPRIKSLPFMASKPWVRHDEHYHVDFAIRCAPKR